MWRSTAARSGAWPGTTRASGQQAERIVGIYSDPEHVFAYSDGEVRQEFNICLAATIVGGELAVSHESTDVRFFPLDEVSGLTMHPSIRKRIDDYLVGGEPRLR